jgi:hypothetical protein
MPTSPPTRSCLGCDTRRQSFPRPPGARGHSGPRVSSRSRPLSATRRLQKVSPGGGRSKPTPPDTQSVKTEQPNDVQASSDPRHLDGPQCTAISPSYAPAHVDHRLEPSNHLVPDLSYYIRDKVGPRWERIPIQSPDTPFYSILLRSIPSARQPGEGHREQGNPERGTESLSSTTSHRLLALLHGGDSTGSETTLGLAPN